MIPRCHVSIPTYIGAGADKYLLTAQSFNAGINADFALSH